MSLINQVLQDLERRRADASPRTPVSYVRALPRERDGGGPMWMIGAGVAVGAIALAALAARVWQSPPERVTTHEAPATSVVVPARPAPGPAPAPTRVAVEADRRAEPEVAFREPVEAMQPAARLSLDLAREPDLTRSQLAAPPPVEADPPATVRTGKPLVAVLAKEAAASTAAVAARGRDARAAEVPKPDAAAKAAPVTQSAQPVAPAAPGAVSAQPAVAATVSPRSPAPADAAPVATAEIKQVSREQRAENEFRRGSAALHQGRAAEAQEAFEQALAINRLHDGARQALFGMHLSARRLADAERLLAERLQAAPDHPGFAMALARLQLERGDAEAALEGLRKVLPAARENADVHGFLAAIHQRQSRHGEAIEHYRSALRLRPQAGVWWMGLGLSLQAANRPAEAQDAYQRARASNSLNGELLAFVDQRIRQLQ